MEATMSRPPRVLWSATKAGDFTVSYLGIRISSTFVHAVSMRRFSIILMERRMVQHFQSRFILERQHALFNRYYKLIINNVKPVIGEIIMDWNIRLVIFMESCMIRHENVGDSLSICVGFEQYLHTLCAIGVTGTVYLPVSMCGLWAEVLILVIQALWFRFFIKFT